MSATSRRSLTFRQANRLISSAARNSRAPTQQCLRAARGPGLITTEGYLHQCGNRFFVMPNCSCVRAGQAAVDCGQCGGTGRDGL